MFGTKTTGMKFHKNLTIFLHNCDIGMINLIQRAQFDFERRKTMKKALVGILTLGLIIGLIGSSVGMGQKTLGTLQTNVSTTTVVDTEQELEEYVPKVIIEGKWGKGEDEFYQVYKDLPKDSIIEFKPVYRYSFDIDNKRNIYILTGSKVLKYESNGKWVKTIKIEPPVFGHDIRVDDSGNIFVIFYPWNQPDKFPVVQDWHSSGVKIYNKHLQLKDTYKLRKKTPEGGYSLYKDELGNIWYEDQLNRYPLSVKGKIYDKSKQLKSAQLKMNLSKDKKYYYKVPKKEDFFEILDTQGKLVKKVNTKVGFPAKEKKFLTLDEDGNFYLSFNTHLFEKLEVHKYGIGGRLICRIKMKPPNFERKLLFAPRRSVMVDKFGNIYQLYFSDKKGVKIIKWERVEK
jgi:hypothetical protein